MKQLLEAKSEKNPLNQEWLNAVSDSIQQLSDIAKVQKEGTELLQTQLVDLTTQMGALAQTGLFHSDLDTKMLERVRKMERLNLGLSLLCGLLTACVVVLFIRG